MNEKKPTWTCPVCDSPAKYEDLMVDGYFEEVIKSPLLPEEENEIILNQAGVDILKRKWIMCRWKIA